MSGQLVSSGENAAATDELRLIPVCDQVIVVAPADATGFVLMPPDVDAAPGAARVQRDVWPAAAVSAFVRFWPLSTKSTTHVFGQRVVRFTTEFAPAPAVDLFDASGLFCETW